MWMRLSKFSLCNKLSCAELAFLFASDRSYHGTDGNDLRRADVWDLGALAAMLAVSVQEVLTGFCARDSNQAVRRACKDLRYCPSCMTSGFHAAWFQWVDIQRCPLHGLPLRTGCMQCSTPIPYALGSPLASSPLACPSCSVEWVPSLTRAAGRCAPLSNRDARTLSRWSKYIEHVVSGEHGSARDPSSGRFASPPLACFGHRPHHLTTLNRLFNAPPPMLSQLVTRRAARHHHRLTGLANSSFTVDPLCLKFDRVHWPHFDHAFEDFELLVHGARMRMFEESNVDSHRGRWRHLLSGGLVAPIETMPVETAAALGWAVSWMGSAQALAPSTETTTPALGLTAWLATLPLRPPKTPKHQWHVQVRAWLRDDLSLSAWAWARMADFMRNKGHYVLHGAVVDPRDLAVLHVA